MVLLYFAERYTLSGPSTIVSRCILVQNTHRAPWWESSIFPCSLNLMICCHINSWRRLFSPITFYCKLHYTYHPTKIMVSSIKFLVCSVKARQKLLLGTLFFNHVNVKKKNAAKWVYSVVSTTEVIYQDKHYCCLTVVNGREIPGNADVNSVRYASDFRVISWYSSGFVPWGWFMFGFPLSKKRSRRTKCCRSDERCYDEPVVVPKLSVCNGRLHAGSREKSPERLPTAWAYLI